MDHDMMTTMTSSGTTTGTAAMASATMNMSNSSSSSMMMTSADMAMVFFQSATTPLYASSWTPEGEGSYAGTCIFLIMLAVVHRILIALRYVLIDTVPKVTTIESLTVDDTYKNSPESVGYRVRTQWTENTFKVATEATRALFEVVIGGVGYLLMLAVMTMNVGYFISVLAGIFLGTFIAGRFGTAHNHS